MNTKKTITLNKKEIPVEDVLMIRPVMVSDQLYSEFKYRLFEPCYHEVNTLVPRDKAYEMELNVRKYKNR